MSEMRRLINIVTETAGAGTPQDAPPKPYLIEYPYGTPTDSFRNFAKDYNSTAVCYYRGVDPQSLVGKVRAGNALRYEVDDLVTDMRANGFKGGDGQRIHIWVDTDGDAYFAEGNHRFTAALQAGVQIELEIRYKGNADLNPGFLVFPYDPADPAIRVISD
jgi:hypothetical protein